MTLLLELPWKTEPGGIVQKYPVAFEIGSTEYSCHVAGVHSSGGPEMPDAFEGDGVTVTFSVSDASAWQPAGES